MAKRYNVSDGKLVITLEEAGGGWYCVTTPMDPGVTTQARSIPEAFMMARDAMKVLRRGRARLHKERSRKMIA
jgi:antitoxin HicB